MPVSAKSKRWSVWLCDEDARPAVPSGANFRIVKRPRAATVRKLFVFCSAVQLPGIARLVTKVNRRNQLMALFLRQDADSIWLPQMLARANLRAVRSLLVFSDLEIPKRVLTAWQHGAERDLIARALVAGDRLFVTSCVPETLEIGFEELPALSAIARRHRPDFEVSSDGSYIHWRQEDVHLNLDSIRCAIEPAYRAERASAQLARLRNWGTAISTLRKRHALRQCDIPGISERQMRRIESGTQVTSAALRKLSAAHGLELEGYLDAVVKESNAQI